MRGGDNRPLVPGLLARLVLPVIGIEVVVNNRISELLGLKDGESVIVRVAIGNAGKARPVPGCGPMDRRNPLVAGGETSAVASVTLDPAPAG